MTIILRPDQANLKHGIYDAWRGGARNVLAIAPTGSGKTVLSTDLILDGHGQGLTEVVMAHRNELVGQMSLAVARRGIPHRLIASRSTIVGITQEHRQELGRSFVNPDARTSVGSVQTIMSKADMLRQWAQQVNRWTLDEAHHAIGNARVEPNIWGKAIRMFPNAYGLGVTACPTRADGKGCGSNADGPFDIMVVGPTMRELIDIGALSDYEMVCPSSDLVVDDEDFADSGDLSHKKGRLASKQSHIVGDVVTEYQRYALGKRAICFATDVETAGEMASRFNEAGILAVSISAKTDDIVRRDMIRRFRDGRMTVLVNVDLFDEGFDVPGCEVVIMARPTGSLNKYLQMFGRGMRRDPANPSKVGLVIDHVSNWKRHGFPDKPHAWTLDRRDKRAKREADPDDIPLTACRSCSRPYERFRPACPYCGARPPVPEGGARSVDQVDGDLTLLDMATLAQMRAATMLEAPGDVSARVEHATGNRIAGMGAGNRAMERHASQQRLTGAIEQWAGVRRHRGESDVEIMKRFYLTAGIDVLGALAQSRADMDRISGMVESWYQ